MCRRHARGYCMAFPSEMSRYFIWTLLDHPLTRIIFFCVKIYFSRFAVMALHNSTELSFLTLSKCYPITLPFSPCCHLFTQVIHGKYFINPSAMVKYIVKFFIFYLPCPSSTCRVWLSKLPVGDPVPFAKSFDFEMSGVYPVIICTSSFLNSCVW